MLNSVIEHLKCLHVLRVIVCIQSGNQLWVENEINNTEHEQLYGRFSLAQRLTSYLQDTHKIHVFKAFR